MATSSAGTIDAGSLHLVTPVPAGAADRCRQVVRVELRDYAARMAQERSWHPTQELRRLNNAGTRVEICFHVSRLEEMVRWVLSWGSKAKVLGPPELKRLVRDEVRQIELESAREVQASN